MVGGSPEGCHLILPSRSKPCRFQSNDPDPTHTHIITSTSSILSHYYIIFISYYHTYIYIYIHVLSRPHIIPHIIPYYPLTFQLPLGQVITSVTYETGNQTWFPEPRFDVAIGTVTKQVGTMTKRIESVNIYLGTVRT